MLVDSFLWFIPSTSTFIGQYKWILKSKLPWQQVLGQSVHPENVMSRKASTIVKNRQEEFKHVKRNNMALYTHIYFSLKLVLTKATVKVH